MTTYIVCASVTKSLGDYTTTRQIPTFLLDAGLLGIMSVKHAKQIAKDVIDPLNLYDSVSIAVMED